MPRTYKTQLNAVSNVAASKTALIDIPIGRRLHYVVLEHGYTGGTNTVAGAMANITEIRFKINGRVQRVFSGVQLRDLNILNGAQYDCQGVPNTAPGVSIPIYFAEPWRKDLPDQIGNALPTVWQSGRFETVQIEVDIGAATSPTLVAHAVMDDVVPALKAGQKFPWFTKVIRPTVAAAGTKFDVPTLDKRDWLTQISVYPDSGGANKPSQVTLLKNSDILHDYTYSANFALLTNHDMTPTASGRTASVYDLVLDHNDVLGGAEDLSSATELILRIEAASAMSGTTTLIVQRIGPPE